MKPTKSKNCKRGGCPREARGMSLYCSAICHSYHRSLTTGLSEPSLMQTESTYVPVEGQRFPMPNPRRNAE